MSVGGSFREALRATRVQARGGCRIVLEGSINERSNLRQHFEGLIGTIVIDLDKVNRITSFGVLEWRSALRYLEGASFYAFIRCRPCMVTQFNVVDGFGEKGELVSLYLPYVCSSCANEFELLVDLRHHYAVAVTREPPYALCRKCGAEAEFDGLPDDFMSFVGSRPRPHVPPAAFALIDGVVGDLPENLRVRKEIDGAVTSVRLAGPINAGARLRSALEGVEGFLIIDLGEVTSVDPAGVGKISAAVAELSVVQCVWARLPIVLLAPFIDSYDRTQRSGGLCSVVIADQCPKCLAPGAFEVSRRNVLETAAEARCPSCRAQVRLVVPHATLRELRATLSEPGPEIAEYLSGKQAVNVHVDAAIPNAESFHQLTIVGESAAFREISETLRKVAPTNATVLLRGETGTGKEMLARLVHALSPRRNAPFVAINCAALPESMIESELFGHERGAFTGATHQAIGRFERADGGTLFIDEVGDIPPSVQVKLLRALQEKVIERVGSSSPIPIDIRLIAATHRPLEDMMGSGAFREDLFFRISVVPVFVPPLRQRPADIWPIALHYLGEAQRRAERTGIRFSERMRRAFQDYSWPGNVRELINVVERTVALTQSNTTADLVDFASGATAPRTTRPSPDSSMSGRSMSSTHPPGRSGSTTIPPGRSSSASIPPPVAGEHGLKATVDEFEKKLIRDALTRSSGNRTHAARDLGISRQALVLKIAKYGL